MITFQDNSAGQSSDDLFLEVFKFNPVGMIISDLESTKFEYVNRQFCSSFGYSSEEVIGKTSLELNLIDPESRKKNLSSINKNGEVENSEILATKKDGSRFWSLTSVRLLNINNKKYALTSFFDISNRIQVESELKQSKGLFYELFNNNPAGISIRDLADNKIIDVNNSLLKLFGFTSKEEMIGKDTVELNILVNKSKAFEIRGLLKEHKVISDYELHVETLAGKQIWLLTSFVVIQLEGKPCLLTVSIDVTERKKAETLNLELQKKQEGLIDRLEYSNKELKSFAHIVSHDLKTPLRGISTIGQWLTQDYSKTLDEKGKELLNMLDERCKRMDALIDGILNYSKINYKNDNFNKIDLNNLVSGLIKGYKITSDIEIKLKGDLPDLVGDEIKISQVFQNLINNSIAFNDKVKGQIEIGCEPQEKQWRFYVKDNGKGIEHTSLIKIFELFSVEDLQNPKPNSGVGLSIVKKIIESYDGTVWAESVKGQGSTFFFTFPFEH